MKATMALVAAVIAAVAHAQSANAQTTGAQDDPILATVNGEAIYGSDVNAMYASLPQQYQQMPPENLLPQMMDNLVDRKLLAQAARTGGMLDDPEVRARMARNEDIILQDVYLVRRIEAEIDDASLRAAYRRMTSTWPNEEEVRASHILVATEQEAMAVIDALAAGAAFADLARESSIGPSASAGGDLGYIRHSQMVPSFADAAFALAAGQVSASPVQTQFGWHVITVMDSRVSQLPSFEDSRQGLREQETQALVRNVVAALRAQAAVEMFAPDGSRAE
jgi:peptidyl-prolyl cis-trans isomerase C